ncbi:universal stress protein [Aquibium sp. ELW1220]|uniref:universal stress protein n=1 Tax=Aquibium sp. ELW1220 TaxID=2976766 RepID=UPI0025B11C03|nr:universal stress protein [Aquibium sp. ELW1220]MDN2581593.1 universal stress protein [Aquibium sp. ELW1220]
MTYKTIVAVLQDEAGAPAMLDAAVALASRFGAQLVGVHAEPLPMPIASPMGFPDATLIGASEDINRAREKRLGELFASRMARADLSCEWRTLRSFSGDSALSALESARCGDIVLAGHGGGEGGSPDIDTLIQGAGRPVLLLPKERPVRAEVRRAVVAWNGSREAARAAFDALPFLMETEETTLLTIDPIAGEGVPLPGSEIAAALTRHGVKVTIEAVSSGDWSRAQVMERTVRAKNADLLVLGAFSHSRLREMIFGGTTRSIIENPPCLTLMAR